jgi:hypothetical protein
MSHGEFSVYQFFPDDVGYENVLQFVDVETAMETVCRLTQSVGARLGMVERIIITDGGDQTCFEWKYGEGITFPTPEMRKATAS